MPIGRECPVCGARCRLARDRSTGGRRLAALQERGLLARVERLEAALLRVRASVKAEAHRRRRRLLAGADRKIAGVAASTIEAPARHLCYRSQ
jgi:hypothetical protein